MDRREFLITSSGAAVAAASSAAAQAEEAISAPHHAHAGAGRALKLSMPWADTPQGPADSVRRLARRFEAMTDGRYRIGIASGNAGPEADADIVHGSAHDFASLHPAFAYFAGLPGSAGLGPQDFAHWIAVGGGQMLWDDLAAGHGWKPLLTGHAGDTPSLWSQAPIAGLSDLAGRRVAAPGLGCDVARALGAETHEALRPHEAAAALAQGALFAAEAGDLPTSLAAGLPGVARHATGQGFNGRGTALSLSIRLSVWEQLPEADKAILAAAAAEEYQLSLAEARAHAGVARQVLEGHLGVSFAPWPADVAEALDRVAEATIAHVAGHDAVAARIDQSYMAFRSMISGAPAPLRSPSVA
jgi:TRAP-type mannitol/chloroaromatic compound transport system substrate-binding protein